MEDSSGLQYGSYFCHKCERDVDHLQLEYVCPVCNDGFVELRTERGGSIAPTVGASSSTPISTSWTQVFRGFGNTLDPAELAMFPRIFESPLFQRNGNVNRTSSDSSSSTAAGNDRVRRLLRSDPFQDNGIDRNGGSGGVNEAATTFGGIAGIDLDYIVVPFLEQLDTSGAPPLSTKQIKDLPLISVDQNHIDLKLQCSVCWEDFAMAEHMRQLPCDHLYHKVCIEKWLKLHGNCPICRRLVNSGSRGNASTMMPSSVFSRSTLLEAVQRRRNSNGVDTAFIPFCSNCNTVGHESSACPLSGVNSMEGEQQQLHQGVSQRRRHRLLDSTVRCFACDNVGHIARHCPALMHQRAPVSPSSSSVASSFGSLPDIFEQSSSLSSLSYEDDDWMTSSNSIESAASVASGWGVIDTVMSFSQQRSPSNNVPSASNAPARTNARRSARGSFPPRICYGCGRRGHIIRNCHRVNMACFRCGQIGHLVRDCDQNPL